MMRRRPGRIHKFLTTGGGAPRGRVGRTGGAPLACRDQTIRVPLAPVWPARSDQTNNIFPRTGAIPTAGLSSVRVTLEIDNMSATFDVQWGLQTSDDGVTFGSVTLLGTMKDTNGKVVHNGTESIAAAVQGKLYVRFVIVCKNDTSGTTLEMAMAGGELDLA